MLTKKDLELLLEALEAWEKGAVSSRLMSEMMITLLVPKEAKDDNKYKLEQKKRIDEAEEKGKNIKRLSMRLKVKLIDLIEQIDDAKSNLTVDDIIKKD